MALALVHLKKKFSWIKFHYFSIFRSPKRKPEDKALKEKRNQAAGQQLKASSAVLKREKPISSSDRRSVKSSSLGESTKTTRTRPSTAKSGTYFMHGIFFVKLKIHKKKIREIETLKFFVKLIKN